MNDLCPTCGRQFKRLDMHTCKGRGVLADVDTSEVLAPRTERGRRRTLRNFRQLTPLEQIRGVPNSAGGTLTGAWAYYINPTGATIRDALVIYPNGGSPPPTTPNAHRYAVNADYYRARQRRKGLEYVGSTLTPDGVKRLVEVLLSNQDEEVMDLEDQIVEVTHIIETTESPAVRDSQRRRKEQLVQRLQYVKQEIDADKLIAELNEIARAQRMSKVSPETLAVMREMIGEQSAKFMEAVAKFNNPQNPAEIDASVAVG